MLRKRGDITEDNEMIIVYCYVCGDILNKGHIEYLKNCKVLGDKLFIGVLTDTAIMEKKSKPMPIKYFYSMHGIQNIINRLQ